MNMHVPTYVFVSFLSSLFGVFELRFLAISCFLPQFL